MSEKSDTKLMKHLGKIPEHLAYALFLLPFLALVRFSLMLARGTGNIHNPHQWEYLAVYFPILVGLFLSVLVFVSFKDLPKIVEKFRAHAKIYGAFLTVSIVYNVLSEHLMVMDTTLCGFFPGLLLFNMALFVISFFLALLGSYLFALGVSTRKQVSVWFWSLMLSSLGAPAILSGDINFLKTHALGSASQAGNKIIRALEAYKLDHKDYPQSLKQLIPRYLEGVPPTGMCGYPKFAYIKERALPHSKQREGYGIDVEARRGVFMSEPALFYWSSQKYPERMRLKKIDDWAYIHR